MAIKNSLEWSISEQVEMFSNRKRQEFLTSEFVWLWMALAFQAGFVNAGGFLACSRFVSHVTGFGTQVGISLSQLDYDLAFEMISAPAAFLFGAIVSALAVDRPLLHGRRPSYLWVMLFLVAIFLMVTVGGTQGLFGEFGEPMRFQRDFLLMSLLCFACGMQNACFTSLTQGQIRTTHLTGILTDMGITIVRLFHVAPGTDEELQMRRMNLIRTLTFLSFSSGSAISAVLFSKLAYKGFGFVVASSALLFCAFVLKENGVPRRRPKSNVGATLQNYRPAARVSRPRPQALRRRR